MDTGSQDGASTYGLGGVVVADTLAIKDEADAVLGLSHPFGIRLLELGELCGTLHLEEDLVSIGVLDLDVELLTTFGLGLWSFGVRHVEWVLVVTRRKKGSLFVGLWIQECRFRIERRCKVGCG